MRSDDDDDGVLDPSAQVLHRMLSVRASSRGVPAMAANDNCQFGEGLRSGHGHRTYAPTDTERHDVRMHPQGVMM